MMYLKFLEKFSSIGKDLYLTYLLKNVKTEYISTLESCTDIFKQ